MPIYCYKCVKCGVGFERQVPAKNRHKQKCSCGGKGEILYVPPNVALFKPQWDENLGPEPIFIESEKQYKQELDKHGLISSWDGI